jgi:hypothetical protein
MANILAPLLLEAKPLQDGLIRPSFDFDRRMTRNFGELAAKVNDGVLRTFGESASLLLEPPLQFARRHNYMVSSSANEVHGRLQTGRNSEPPMNADKRR